MSSLTQVQVVSPAVKGENPGESASVAQRVVPMTIETPENGFEFQDVNLNHQELKPTDGGVAAWRVLWAAFVFEALLWGFPLSYGVFQDYYSQQPQFANSPYTSIVGPIATGICFLGAPIVTPIVKKYPRYQRQMVWAGWPFCILGLVAGSFASTLGTLIVTQGIMYGFGYLIFYYPIVNMVNEWWITRRGMAFGILCSATGVSGVAMPFILEELLKQYGYRTTLRAMAIGLALLTGPLLPLVTTRIPAAQQTRLPKTDWSFTKSPLFYIYNLSNVIQGLGYYLPSLFLPSYATSIGLSSTQGALLLALVSIAQVLGQFTFGYLSDGHFPLSTLIMLSTGVSGTAVLTLWGLSHSIGPLIAFSLIYGFFAAGYVSMWPRMGMAISNEPTSVMANFGIFCFGKGLGNVLAGPLSNLLLSQDTELEDYAVLRYKALVVFTGACMLGSGCVVGLWRLWRLWMRNA